MTDAMRDIPADLGRLGLNVRPQRGLDRFDGLGEITVLADGIDDGHADGAIAAGAGPAAVSR